MHTHGGDRVSWVQWLSSRSVLGHEGAKKKNCTLLGERRLRVESQKDQHLHSGLRGWVGIGRKGREGCKAVLCGDKSMQRLAQCWRASEKARAPNLRSPRCPETAKGQTVPRRTIGHTRCYRVGSRSPMTTYVTLNSWSPCPYWFPILPEGKYTHRGLQWPAATAGKFPIGTEPFLKDPRFMLSWDHFFLTFWTGLWRPVSMSQNMRYIKTFPSSQ